MVLELLTLKHFLICSYFLPSSTFFFLQGLWLKGVHVFLYKQPWLLSVEAQKWSKVNQQLSNDQAQIVPRFKQLRLKSAAQEGTLLVEEC